MVSSGKACVAHCRNVESAVYLVMSGGDTAAASQVTTGVEAITGPGQGRGWPLLSITALLPIAMIVSSH